MFVYYFVLFIPLHVYTLSNYMYIVLLYMCVQAVGQLGSVQGVNNDGNVAVLMKTHLWTFNPLCLRHAEKEEEQEVSSQRNITHACTYIDTWLVSSKVIQCTVWCDIYKQRPREGCYMYILLVHAFSISH